jgi:hypothetical protein
VRHLTLGVPAQACMAKKSFGIPSTGKQVAVITHFTESPQGAFLGYGVCRETRKERYG